MNSTVTKLKQSPAWVRAAPFLVFIVITMVQNNSGQAGMYWCYVAKTVVVAWMLWTFRRPITEMRWRFSWEAIAVGIAVFVMWVGLTPLLELLGGKASWIVRKPSIEPAWNPLKFFD